MMMGGINKHRVSPLFKHFQLGQQWVEPIFWIAAVNTGTSNTPKNRFDP